MSSQHSLNNTLSEWLRLKEAYPSLFEYDDYSDYYEVNYLPDVSVPAKIALCIVLGIITIFCGLGNTLLCITIFRLKRLRNVTNLFIASLAVSDLLVAVICAPLSLYYYIVQNWVFGTALCTIVGTVKNVSLNVSVNTLLTIGIERYYVIHHPMKPRLQKRTVLVVTLGTWLLSSLVALPTPLFTTVSSGYDRDGRLIHYCGEYWSNRLASRAYIAFLTVTEYLVPMTILTFAYCSIVRKVWFHQMPGATTGRNRDIAGERKKKTIRMLILVMIFFGICWGPYYIYNLLIHFNEDILSDDRNNMTMFYIVESIAMSNGLLNTIVYFLMNDAYRKECWDMLAVLFKVKKGLARRGNLSVVTTTRTSARSSFLNTRNSRLGRVNIH
ncbi:prokineticin receptor 2-like [Saccoglossus kowalevskii]